MAKISRPRHGSLQYWPRKRAAKALPSANWKVVDGEGILGIIGYKVGMGSAIVRDNTPNSMTKGKKVVLPVTIVEVPPMKIFAARFYKKGIVMKDVILSTDKELKRVVKLPKQVGSLEGIKDFDDMRVLVYPVLKDMFKKTPDLIEVAVNVPDKIEWVKGMIGKEISLNDFKHVLIDARGLTKGKGLVGPVQRFGLNLKAHKSEKGVRRPGSLAPWHPARITFRTPMAGQLGMFSRVTYNLKIVSSGNIKENDINKKDGFKEYGRINNSYVIVHGSVQGPPKRQVLLTAAMRPNKRSTRKNYELLELKL